MKKLIILIIVIMFTLSISILKVNANNRKHLFQTVDNTELTYQNGIYLKVISNESVYSININYDLFFFEEGGENVYKADCLWDNQDNIQLIQFKITQKDNIYLLELIFVDNDDWFRVEKIINKSIFDKFNILVDYSIEVSERIDNSNIEIMMYLRSCSNSSNTNLNMTRDLVLEDGGGMGGGGGTGDDSGSEENNNSSSRGIIGITPPAVTLSDQYLDVYNVNGGTHITTGYLWKDDDVVKIIPKTYFFQQGDFSCIGKEYGYFIETVRLAEGYYASFVFVFDIEFKQFGFGLTHEKAESSLKIIPKFKNWYYSYEKGTSSFIYDWDDKVAPGYNSIVKPSGESIAHCLKDVQIGFMLENEHSLNINDEGYNALQDYGDFIEEAIYSCKGQKILVDTSHVTLDDIMFALSQVPFIENIIDFIDDTNGFIQLINDLVPNGNYYEEVEIDTELLNKYELHQYYEPTSREQFNEYGFYVKSVLSYLDNQDIDDGEQLIFLPNGTDFVQATIKANQISTNYGEEMRNHIIIDITLGLEESNSNKVIEDNRLFYITDYGKYKLYPDKLFLNTPQAFNVDVAGKYAYFYFIPSTSGSYTIKTTGTNDTYMYLYDVNGNLIESDDDDGDSTNASITRHLEANEVYYIKTRLYTDYRTGTYSIIVE